MLDCLLSFYRLSEILKVQLHMNYAEVPPDAVFLNAALKTLAESITNQSCGGRAVVHAEKAPMVVYI